MTADVEFCLYRDGIDENLIQQACSPVTWYVPLK
jgi:hypothetical protein